MYLLVLPWNKIGQRQVALNFSQYDFIMAIYLRFLMKFYQFWQILWKCSKGIILQFCHKFANNLNLNMMHGNLNHIGHSTKFYILLNYKCISRWPWDSKKGETDACCDHCRTCRQSCRPVSTFYRPLSSDFARIVVFDLASVGANSLVGT